MLTVGIPSFNRCTSLRSALDSVLIQTSRDVKVIVSDNASTDDTEAVARAYGGRIRYVRNSANIGPMNNFKSLVELCETKFFSWLQDDDCLHRRFAERALKALRSDPSVTVYTTYAMLSHGLESHYKATVIGPPFPADFMGGEEAQIHDGRLVTPFSLLMSVSFPPAVVFRTEAIREYLRSAGDLTALFAERSCVAHAAAAGRIAVDPYIGAILRLHPGQGQYGMLHQEQQEWRIMAQGLDQLAATWSPDWLDGFTRILRDTEPAYRETWLGMAEAWPRDIALCTQVSTALRDSLPGYKRQTENPWKVFLRQLSPPILWSGLGAAKRKIRSARAGE